METINDIKECLISDIEDKVYNLYNVPFVFNGGGVDFISEYKDVEWITQQIMEREVSEISKDEAFEDFRSIEGSDEFKYYRIANTAPYGQQSNEIQIALW